MKPITLFWHRRDLRLHDNAGLYRALRSKTPVLPLFIFDSNILDDLEDKEDARVSFIHDSLSQMKAELEAMGSSMMVTYGRPEEVWQQILKTHQVAAVYTNHDFEPYALQRDQAIAKLLKVHGIPLHSFKDHIIFEKEEVLKDDGTPYTVFTPYSRKWLKKLATRSALGSEGTEGDPNCSFYLQSYPNEKYFSNFYHTAPIAMLSLQDIGFRPSSLPIPSTSVTRGLVRNYSETRDFPAQAGTSRLGIHFRFGTISIREKARHAQRLNPTFLNELIWRDFYATIMAHFPFVVERSFRKKYDFIEWRNNAKEFQCWCEGRTGYPIVDAGMRELNQTGHMHNRVRMIVASFLAKHLLIDWRWGEAYFAKKLLDFDLASNNGGWQWAAGCGTDAAPYFRIFNPYSQQKKFDKGFEYVKRWVPEYDTPEYVDAIVDHPVARQRCLDTYKAGLVKAELG